MSLEYSEDGVEWLSYNKENNLKPGNYDVRIRQMSDIANFRIGKEVVGEGSLVVNRGTLNSTSFKAINVSQIYDGLSHPVTPEYVDGLVGTNANIQTTYTTFEGQDITGTPKDAGVYRVFATVPADGDNYLATAEPVEVGTITILPANVPSEHINVADLSHVFDGKDHEATVSLDNKYGDITSVEYKTEDGVVVDKPTNAGRYEVLLSTSSKNYVSLDNEVVGVLNITKATPTAKDFKFDSEKTYTGSKLDAKVVSTNDLMTTEAAGALTVKYNGDANQPVNAGKYDVTVETAGGTNYNPVTLDLGTFEITKAPVTKANLTGKANNATYDGKEHSASYDWKAGMVGTGALTLTYKGEGYNSTVAPVTAGTYDVYASAPAGDNYQALESVKIADLKISKADLDAKNFNDVSANYVYDFKSHPAKVAYLPGTEGTAPITVTYKTAAGKAVSGAPTNAGTYEVYAQAVKDGVNYNAMAKPVKVGTIKIAKADKPLPQIKVSDNKFTYDGKSHQAKVTMDKKYGDLSVTYKDEKGKIVAKPTNTGVYQIIANTVSDNFEELHDITVGELTIEGLTPKSSEFTFTKSGTYNGKSQSAKVAFAPGVTEAMAGKMTVHYVDAKGNKTNSITNAGTYKVYVSTTGGTNFKPVNNLLVGSMTIAKAPVASDKFSVKNTEVTFNGQSQSPTVTLPAKYGDITKIEYRDENGKIYDKVENPGKYDILVTTKGTANYAGADRLVIGTFTIDEQTPEPTPTPAPNDNGGNAGGGTTPAASTVVPASGPTAYNATTTVPAVTAATTPSAVAPATQTMGTQTQATATPAADNATIRHGAVTDPLHGPEEVNDPVTSVAQKDTQGLSNYTIAGIWMAVAVALAGAFYIGMRWMQVGRKRHLMQK
ncbi:MBG domain-containing protein [Weissella confusa]|uniref:MBG domain-containing protein n=1 Tax=Weissella confusa TaxID=1583 RepID=UPI0022DEBBF1|nr:MBG domain-containing protein [Weissella confusa]